jgi:hypothetical protein
MFAIFIIVVAIMNISLVATLIRLKLKHDDVFVSLGLGETVFGSPKQLARIIEFMIKRKPAELNDFFLTGAGYVFVASLVITILLIYASFFYK